MYLRLHRWIALLGLTLAPNLYAQTPLEPAPLPSKPADTAPAHVDSENQQMASAIAEHLKQSAHLRNYFVEVSFKDRTATLNGHVTDQMQKDEVLRLVQGIPNVERVIDRLVVPLALTPVRAEDSPPPAPLPLPLPSTDPEPNRGSEGAFKAPALAPEPTPIFSAPPPNGAELNPPRMPPYAWPTYAPYNNFSRVAYPLSYPYNAFPYIGPFYPFPKVPLGWRSVKLEWDDGYWWFTKHNNKYDWWRLRFH